MSRFGTSVADSANSDTWILGFKDGVTRIRIAQEIPTWVKYQQHFSKVAFYFPHIKGGDASNCIGCKYPEYFNDKGEVRLSYQYAFNALDQDGRLRVYRLGTDAYKILKSRFDRLGTLMDRDHNIVRTGKGLDTTYIPEPGDKYEIEIPTDLKDIYQALDDKYEEAEKKILAAIQAEMDEAAAASAEASPAKPKVDAKVKGSADPEAAAVQRAVEADLGGKEVDPYVDVDFEDMSTGDIKDFLAARKVEIPSRAARAKLIEMAEESKHLPAF